ncbi:beta-lactamase family protein [Arthroderma uncinatum]|uniref:beta-lactamase family protein n=1 Tax=Arthroderma uncinatum TaxID=74035 RepID=UPI00144AB992|nr:beta-lactamase family protein [Arthroderma uncinatum]KAF3491611.1 beta-lactamase family protein [Arthroderma uncinatum]
MELLRSPEFTAYVKNLLDRHHIPGLAIAIIHDDYTDSVGFGKASLDPPKECTGDTLFDVASVSKALTAASVALLIDDDYKYPLIKYDTPMASLLPEDFVMPGGDHDDVTVEDVLSHRTGMPSHDHSYLGVTAAKPDDARSITRNLRNLTVAAPNRAQYFYCNMMYTVAAYLVECKTGLPFSDFLQTHIFKPLDMNSTNLQPEAARAKGLGDRFATGYFWDEKAEKYKILPCVDSPEATGAGRVISSANDYIKWIKAMVKKQAPITESIYEGLVKKRISEAPPVDSDDSESEEEAHSVPTFYAAGWEVLEYSGYTMITHDGADHGFGSTNFFIPELNFGAVILGNSNHASEVARILKYKMADWAVRVPKSDTKRVLDSMAAHGSESESDNDDHATISAEVEKELIEEMCPETKEAEPQTLPLSAYVGEYWNDGYRGVKVEEKDGALYLDGSDRSMGFTIIFKHIRGQTMYIGYIGEAPYPERTLIRADFKLEGDKAVEIGLQLEDELDDYIWFKRVEA